MHIPICMYIYIYPFIDGIYQRLPLWVKAMGEPDGTGP